jgi:hypothetical protein
MGPFQSGSGLKRKSRVASNPALAQVMECPPSNQQKSIRLLSIAYSCVSVYSIVVFLYQAMNQPTPSKPKFSMQGCCHNQTNNPKQHKTTFVEWYYYR